MGISGNNLLNKNYFHDNNYGIWIEGKGNEIINNRVTKTLIGSGITLRGNENLVRGNIIIYNVNGEGIYLGKF